MRGHRAVSRQLRDQHRRARRRRLGVGCGAGAGWWRGARIASPPLSVGSHWWQPRPHSLTEPLPRTHLVGDVRPWQRGARTAEDRRGGLRNVAIGSWKRTCRCRFISDNRPGCRARQREPRSVTSRRAGSPSPRSWSPPPRRHGAAQDGDRPLNEVLEELVSHSGAVLRLRYRATFPDGVTHTLESVARSALDDPAIARIVANTRDVTASARMETLMAMQTSILTRIASETSLTDTLLEITRGHEGVPPHRSSVSGESVPKATDRAVTRASLALADAHGAQSSPRDPCPSTTCAARLHTTLGAKRWKVPSRKVLQPAERRVARLAASNCSVSAHDDIGHMSLDQGPERTPDLQHVVRQIPRADVLQRSRAGQTPSARLIARYRRDMVSFRKTAHALLLEDEPGRRGARVSRGPRQRPRSRVRRPSLRTFHDHPGLIEQ